jgi:hypothetical protein
LDGVGHERGIPGFVLGGVVALADFCSEGADEEDTQGWVKALEVDVCGESKVVAENFPPFPSQRVLLVGTLCDCVVSRDIRRMEESLELMESGSLQM